MAESPPYLEAPGGVRVPTDRLYHREHLWILPLSAGRCRLGLTAYVCRWGIEVYFVENLLPVGTTVASGGEIGTIETEKTVLSLHAPFAGTVTAINEQVLADPSIITFDGYEAGWIMELEGEPGKLLSPEDYREYLRTLPPSHCFVAG